MRYIYLKPLLILYCIFIYQKSTAQSDSIQNGRKNYSFRPQLSLNCTSIGRESERARNRNEQFNYRFQEVSLSGYIPIFEKKYKPILKYPELPSLTLLFTGSISNSRSYFKFTDTKPVVRISAGLRALYYSGNKSIWMLSFAPFISEESTLYRNAVPRFFGSILYTRMVNEYFSYRLGISYSYLFNGGTFLPILGIRVGDYQKVFLNIQIPRDISLYWTINSHWQTGIFSRLSGGIYRFKIDENINNFRNIKGNAVLYRSDILTGFLVNYSPNPNLYFSVNTGVAHNRTINIAFTNELIPTRGHVVEDGRASVSPFINFSLAVYFGKPTYNGSYNGLIEQKAVNNSIDAGDFNLGNNQITNDMNKVGIKDINKKELKKLNDQYMDVKDFLFDE
ncbi:MAG: hypothetical protein ACKVOU_09785 [Cytophagales bacterium]